MSVARMSGAAALKRVLVGRPMASGELEHTLLPKSIALPVFSSDALSSVAYATQEILLVLGTVGVAALGHVVPISVGVAALLAMVVVSYRQTVRAYPNGGGAYIVARENLGMYPGLLAAASLLVDYVLTVSVSVVAGVDAIVSAAPSLAPYEIQAAAAFVLFVAIANLRGVKESGTLFAIPTYGFIVCIGALLVAGLVQCASGCPVAESAGSHLPEAAGTLTILLVLRAFAAGTTALTGVEAISNGVPAFRYPQSKNAATTLAVMGAISISMFLGISLLANATNVVHTEHSERTVVAEIANAVFGQGPMFYAIQIMTAAILILAANTAFADFPRLSSILAQDRFVPRQFMNRGDRLVFSNGIAILSAVAILLIWVFRADLNKLIQLYLVGVFISFTFSQAGMVVHWRRTREPGWRRSAFINGLGAGVTGIVLLVVIVTKFTHGAWIVVATIPVLVLAMRSIHSHYVDVSHQLEHPERRPVDRRPAHQHIVILVRAIDPATARALAYSRSIRSADIAAVAVNAELASRWKLLAPDIPLTILARGNLRQTISAHLSAVRSTLSADDFLTLVVPEILETRGIYDILRRPTLHWLKAAMLGQPDVQVLNVPVVREDVGEQAERPPEPARNYVCVLVSNVTNASLQAIEYAETLRATDVRALSFGFDPDEVERLGNDWLAEKIPHPLEIEASPFRDIGSSLVDYIRRFEADGLNRVVTIVLPEFVVPRRRHQILHNQTALIVKRRMLFEKGVVVVSVPYRLEKRARPRS